MFNIASQMRHRFSQLTISGFAFALSIYVIVNLAMVMGLAPGLVCRYPLFPTGGRLCWLLWWFGHHSGDERQPMADLPK